MERGRLLATGQTIASPAVAPALCRYQGKLTLHSSRCRVRMLTLDKELYQLVASLFSDSAHEFMQ